MLFREKSVPKHQRLIEADLEQSLSALKDLKPDSTEYCTILANAERLHKMMETQTPSPVSRDTIATVAANLVGILLIIRHEDVNVITSKALGFVTRLR